MTSSHYGADRSSYLAELLNLLGSKGALAQPCVLMLLLEAEVIWRDYQAVAINNLHSGSS